MARPAFDKETSWSMDGRSWRAQNYHWRLMGVAWHVPPVQGSEAGVAGHRGERGERRRSYGTYARRSSKWGWRTWSGIGRGPKRVVGRSRLEIPTAGGVPEALVREVLCSVSRPILCGIGSVQLAFCYCCPEFWSFRMHGWQMTMCPRRKNLENDF